MVRGRETGIARGSQVVVVQHGREIIGLLVDALHGVPEFSSEQITPTPFAVFADDTLVPQVIRANRGELPIQVVNLAYLYTALKAGAIPATPEALAQEAA